MSWICGLWLSKASLITFHPDTEQLKRTDNQGRGCEGHTVYLSRCHPSKSLGSREQWKGRSGQTEMRRLRRVDADCSSWAPAAFPRHPLAPLGINFLPGFRPSVLQGHKPVVVAVVTLCDSRLRERSREGERAGTWLLCKAGL